MSIEILNNIFDKSIRKTKRKGDPTKFNKNGYIGSAKQKELNKEKSIIGNLKKSELYKKKVLNYNNNPKLCSQCHNSIEYSKRTNKFCTKSCAAIFNQTGKIRSKNLTEKELYYKKCEFKFQLNENIYGFNLLLTNGIYHQKSNPEGCVRDHMISKNYGWKNKIDPSIISHPANCQILLLKDNSKKSSKCSLTLEELLSKINNWQF